MNTKRIKRTLLDFGGKRTFYRKIRFIRMYGLYRLFYRLVSVFLLCSIKLSRVEDRIKSHHL